MKNKQHRLYWSICAVLLGAMLLVPFLHKPTPPGLIGTAKNLGWEVHTVPGSQSDCLILIDRRRQPGIVYVSSERRSFAPAPEPLHYDGLYLMGDLAMIEELHDHAP